MKCVKMSKSLEDSGVEGTQTAWNGSGSGSILCSKVDADENYALFGGKGVEVNVWDMNQCAKNLTPKSPERNSIGTNSHQVHLMIFLHREGLLFHLIIVRPLLEL